MLPMNTEIEFEIKIKVGTNKKASKDNLKELAYEKLLEMQRKLNDEKVSFDFSVVTAPKVETPLQKAFIKWFP